MRDIPFRAIIGPNNAPINGVSGNKQVFVAARAKPFAGSVAYVLANEFICSSLGARLGLPVPPHLPVLIQGFNQPFFTSIDFALFGGPYPLLSPAHPVECVKKLPDLSTGLVLFDMWISNADRHRGNLSVDFSVSPPIMTVFDQGHALFGYIKDKGVDRLNLVKKRLGCTGSTAAGNNRHVLLDHIADDAYIDKWLTRIEQFPDFMIEDVCKSEFDLGITYAETMAAVDFLKYRRDNLRNILSGNRREFRSILQWSLSSFPAPIPVGTPVPKGAGAPVPPVMPVTSAGATPKP